jgi:hypothetical protein
LKLISRSLSLVALLGIASFANAQTITYNNQATFLANVVPGYYLENFNSLSNGTFYPNPLNFSGNGFAFTVSATNGLYGAAGNGGSALSTNTATDPITFTFTGAPVTAIGGNFFGSDINGNFSAANINITLSNGFTTTLTTPSLTAFSGFTVSSGSISTLTVSSVQPQSGFLWPTVDNLIIGTSTAAVPAPSSFASLLAGAGMGGIMLRRRKRN